MSAPRRRRLAAEVLQSSAMDCGPAALKCLLDGHGLPIGYGRLREACQTDVDGTSIDTLEEVAVALGLDAEQTLVPVDHLLRPSARALPAIAVVRSPGGLAHFVVLWSCRAGVVQLMDPAVGRCLVSRDALRRRLFIHRMPVPVEAVRSWIGSSEFLDPLRARARELHVSRARFDAWATAACDDPHVLPLACLDAAIRLAAELVAAGAVGRGREATDLVERLLRASEGRTGAELFAILPEHVFTAAPGPDATTVTLRGAVLVCVRGARSHAPALCPEGPAADMLSPALRAALHEPRVQPLRQLLTLVHNEGLGWPVLLLGGLFAAAAAVTAEAMVLRAMLDVGDRIGRGEQRLGAAAAILLFFLAVLLLELPLAALVRRMGRSLAARLRIAFLHRVPRLGDRYLASRPISDMAERCHQAHALRALPDVAARIVRGCFELVLTATALVWLDPAGVPWVLVASGTVLVVPLVLQPRMTERDLEVRSHVGALGRFYLDALLGLAAIRTHAAERSLLREQEGLLVEWSRAQRGLHGLQVAAVGLCATVGMLLAAVLFGSHVARHPEPSGALLLLYWALSLPAIGDGIATATFEIPRLRTTALRLLEPLQQDRRPIAPAAPTVELAGEGGVTISTREVDVVAGGHTILQALDLEIPAGQHVAIVGPSGAGKSSLLGLLLGFHRAARGTLHVDGRPLDEVTLAGLRSVTAWVDPAVQLWNDTLLHNLGYGRAEPHARLSAALELSELVPVLERLPHGLQSALGEGGGLLSGGEGQRVRLGRAILHERPRLVLLDEPLRGLDRNARRSQLSRARAHWQGSTLLCVTHDVDAALGFDRVLVIEAGRVIEDDDPAVLSRRTSSRFSALLRADDELHRTGWSDPLWRHLVMERGRLHERTEVRS